MELSEEIHIFFVNKQAIEQRRPIIEIINNIEMALHFMPINIQFLTIKAQILYQYHLDYKQALQIIKKALQLDCLNIDLRLDIVEILIQFELCGAEECQLLLDECKKLDSQYWRYYYVQSIFYQFQQQQGKIIRDTIIQGLKISPNNPWLKSLLSQIFCDMPQLSSKAYNLVNSINLKDGYNYELLRRIAFTLRQFNKNKSEMFLQRAVELNPKNTKTICNLAQYYRLYIKDHHKSIQLCEQALEVQPNYSVAIYNLGKTYQQLEQDEDSVKCFKQCLSFNKFYDIFEQLASYYQKIDNYQEALYYLKRRFKLNILSFNPYYIYTFIDWPQMSEKDECELNLQYFLNEIEKIQMRGLSFVSHKLLSIYE